MALKPETSLELMKHCFPTWSDIRKRTKKSTGGCLLTAYANEYGNIQKAIEAYQKIFFLVNYKGHEDEFPDYLYAANVGTRADVKIDSIVCKLTDDEPYFLEHLDTTALQSGPYILFHEKILPKDAKAILYTVGENQYSADLIKIPIWNAFDEFAKFAGLDRYDGETNKELEARTYAVFKNFPNPTETGIKHAIMNAVVPFADMHPEDITIEPLDAELLDFDSKEAEDIYEQFVQFNHDLFRTKVWNLDNWEHGFQKQGYIPHAWDKPMEVTQDGVGYNDSLKVSYLKDLSVTGLTDVDVYAYKKDFQKIGQYVETNHIEDDIPLTLTKYSDNIQPKKVEYAIRAYTVRQVENPQDIHITATKKHSGTMDIALADLAKEMYSVERIEQGHIDSNEKYMLSFCPQGDFSSMDIYRCNLLDGSEERNLLEEHGPYKFRGNTIYNSYVRAHVTSIADTSWNDNVMDTPQGITIGDKKAEGSFDINVSGMENELVTIQSSCREIDITNSPYVSAYNGFTLGQDGKSYVDTKTDSIATVVVGGPDNPLKCNSFSFTFDSNQYPEKQGTILVTITADGNVEKLSCTHGMTISRSYKKRIPVQIVIQKYGEDPVSIRKIMASSYDIKMELTNGEGLSYLGKYARIPGTLGKDVQLRVSMTPYTSVFPVIEYIHIGGSLKGASYDVEVDTANMASPRLDIDSDCKVTLYRVDSSGQKTVVGTKDEYSTRDSFYCSGDHGGQIVLDISSFPSIERSVPEIQKKYKGTEKFYINLESGETMDSISITGTRVLTLASHTLAHVLLGDDIQDWEVYATAKNRGLILWNRKTKEIRKQYLSHDAFDDRADHFKITGFPADVEAFYVYDNNMRKRVSETELDSQFSHFDFVYTGAKESIAYNSCSMISDLAENIEIANTFSPSTSFGKLYYYEIADAVSSTDPSEVTFMDTGFKYSLGAEPKLRIKTTLPAANKERWPLEVHSMKSSFILSSEILLDASCELGGKWHEIQEYIIGAPKGIQVHYELTDEYHETVQVLASKISKLKYSNLDHVVIDGYTENQDYKVMAEEGILIWLSDRAVGREIEVRYVVRHPAYLTYTKDYEDHLYKVVQYEEEAYKLLETKQFKAKQNRDSLLLDFKESPDRIITKCSNPAFQTSLRDNVLTVVQLADDDRLAIHNGYIYDSGREYYYFNDKYQDQVERVNSVEFHNVSRQKDNMFFHMRSKNFLPNANMETDCLAELCHFDFVNHPASGVSAFNHLTACESYNLWYTVNMDVEIEDVLNGHGLHFKAERSTGYAAVDVTKYIHPNDIVSLYVDGDLKPYIVRETMVDGMPFLKSVFLDMDDSIPFKKEGSYYVCHLPDELEPEAKYHLVLQGSDGRIDDLVSMPESIISVSDAHKKNIDRIGMKIDELVPKNYEYHLDFTADGASFDDLICSSDGELSTSSSVEFGLTKIDDVVLTNCSFEYADYKDGELTSVKDGAIIKTRPLFVKNRGSAYAVYVKVNEIIAGKYRGFGIRVYGSDSLNVGYTLIQEVTGTNLVEIKQEDLKNYLYFELTADAGKVIHSIETYARYAEIDGSSLIPSEKSSGSFISKAYDLGHTATYRFKGVDANVEGEDGRVLYYVRGIRTRSGDAVQTDWKLYREGAEPVLEGYRLVQFKTEISGKDTAVEINDYRMEVV